MSCCAPDFRRQGHARAEDSPSRACTAAEGFPRIDDVFIALGTETIKAAGSSGGL